MGKDNVKSRRLALKKLGGAGAVAGLSAGWIKPVIDTAILPAHASTTTPLCYDVFVRIIDTIPNDNASGGTGQVIFELYTDAPDEFNKVTVTSVTISFGSLTGDTTAELFGGNTQVLGWLGESIPSSAAPIDSTTTLSWNWMCANEESRSGSLNFWDLVVAFEGGQQQEQPAQPEQQSLAQNLEILNG